MMDKTTQIKFLANFSILVAFIGTAHPSGDSHRLFGYRISNQKLDLALSYALKLASGRFAIVQKGKEFSLVPWQK